MMKNASPAPKPPQKPGPLTVNAIAMTGAVNKSVAVTGAVTAVTRVVTHSRP
jgi:hypothetical protein